MIEARLRPNVRLEDFRRRGEGRLPGLIGIEVTELSPGLVRMQVEVRPELLAPNGYLHAATVIALADTACGYGCIAHLPDGAANFTTVELKSNFLGTVREGILHAVAHPVHLGRTTHVWDAEVSDADGRKIALFRCTQIILWPK